MIIPEEEITIGESLEEIRKALKSKGVGTCANCDVIDGALSLVNMVEDRHKKVDELYTDAGLARKTILQMHTEKFELSQEVKAAEQLIDFLLFENRNYAMIIKPLAEEYLRNCTGDCLGYSTEHGKICSFYEGNEYNDAGTILLKGNGCFLKGLLGRDKE